MRKRRAPAVFLPSYQDFLPMSPLRITSTLIASLALLAPATADVLYEWNFDDPSGTSLSEATSSGKIDAQWNLDFDDSVTNGDGQLIVRRTPDGVANAYVTIDSKAERAIQNEIWMLVEIDGWEFSGKSASETMRLGVAHITDEERPHVLAQINLERTDSNQVSVSAESFGDGSISVPPLPIFGKEQTEPVTFVLHIDKGANKFTLHYRMGDGPYLYLGNGATSPEREIRFLRLGFSGYFNASSEQFAINRIAYLSHDPMGVVE
jgi:hypothetical protein